MSVTDTDDLFRIARPANYLLAVSRHTSKTYTIMIADDPNADQVAVFIARELSASKDWSKITVCQIVDGIPRERLVIGA